MKNLPIRLFTALVCVFMNYESRANEPLTNAFIFKFSFILSDSDFGTFHGDLGDPDTSGYSLFTQTSVSNGFGMQFGKMFPLSSLNSSGSLNFGVDVTWVALTVRNVYYIGQYGYYFGPGGSTYRMTYYTAFCEVGPYLSFAPTESFSIDLSLKLTPTIGMIGGSFDNYVLGEKAWNKGMGIGMRYTPALYFSYKKLLLGVEYSIGDLNFRYNIPYQDRFAGLSNKGTSPYSSLRFVLGIRF